MKVTKFEDLEIWKESIKLSIELINILKENKMFSLRDQIIRSAISIPSNIAEGFERESKKEFIRFLNIAAASCGELRTQLYISQQTEFINKEFCKNAIQTTKTLSARINKLIQVVKGKM